MAENSFDYSTLSKTIENKKETDVVKTVPSSVENTFDYNTLSSSEKGTIIGVEPVLDTSEPEQTGSIGVPRADPVGDPLGEKLSADMQATAEEIDIVGSRRAKVVAFSERKDELK